MSGTVASGRVYWITWSILLVFTLVMLWADAASLPRTFFVLFMLAAMLTKASLIGGTFMHLRFERRSLMLTVVVCLLGLGALLYVLTVPDAARIHDMVANGR